MTTMSSSLKSGNKGHDGSLGALREPLLSPPPSLRAVDADEESPASPSSNRHNTILHDDDPEADASYWSFLWRTPLMKRQMPGGSPTARRNLMNSLDQHTYPTFVRFWESLLCRIRWPLLLVVMAVIWPLGALSFLRLTNNTDSTFHPVPKSLSEQAQAAFAESYVDEDWQNPLHPSLLIVLENPDPSSNDTLTDPASPLYEHALNFSIELVNYLDQTCWKVADDKACANTTWTQVTSYYSLLQDDLKWLSESLVANRGRTTLVQVQYLLAANATHVRDRIAQLMRSIQVFGTRYDDAPISVAYTGLKWFQSDLIEATQSDLKKMDAVVLPLALLLMGMVLRNAHAGWVWILPLMAMVTTVSMWSMILVRVAQRMQITQFTPSIMMSVTLGMGFDYSLFLLSRYLELRSKNDRPGAVGTKSRAICHMMYHGGHVLLLSGLTLMCTFLGLCFLPLHMLQSVGIGAAVAIASALLVHLTFVPALLHTRLGDWIVKSPAPSSGNESVGDDDGEEEEAFLQQPIAAADVEQQTQDLPSMWIRLSRHLLHPYKSVIIFLVIVQLALPAILYANKIQSSEAFELILPASSLSLETFHHLGDLLGRGRLSPYRILFDGHAANMQMDSPEAFDVMHRVLDELIAIEDHADSGLTHIATEEDEIEPLTKNLLDSLGMTTTGQSREGIRCDFMLGDGRTTYSGISVLKNIRIPHSLFQAAHFCAKMSPHCPIDSLHLLDYVDRMSTSKDRYATFITATLGVDPFSDEGLQWLESARSTLQRLEEGGALGDVKVYLEGTAATERDAVDAVYSLFPTVVIRTLLVVFLLMGIFFRSLVAPLRSVVSISLTLCFVFGLAVLVFQHGILNWTRMPSFMSAGNEISWLVPVMSFSIIVGLALDYDVFLTSRILEFRAVQGYDHKSSIAAGLDATGGIIMAAGVIMAVAFGGLMFSSSPVLYQWSFLLTTAVLLNTFVIQSLVVPIVMGWTGQYSWWPRRLPKATAIEWDETAFAFRRVEAHGDEAMETFLSL